MTIATWKSIKKFLVENSLFILFALAVVITFTLYFLYTHIWGYAEINKNYVVSGLKAQGITVMGAIEPDNSVWCAQSRGQRMYGFRTSGMFYDRYYERIELCTNRDGRVELEGGPYWDSTNTYFHG